MPDALDRYVEHARRFGVELVFETAAGFGRPAADLTGGELLALARRLRAIDPTFDLARPDKLVASADPATRRAYLERIAPLFDPIAAPAPTSADRCCEWCGRPIAGHSQKRTHSAACRRALARGGGLGPFSVPLSHFPAAPDPFIGPGLDVTLLARKQRGNSAENRGVGDFREVAVDAVQLDLFAEAPST